MLRNVSSMGKFAFSSIIITAFVIMAMLECFNLAHIYSNYQNNISNLKEFFILQEKESIRKEVYETTSKIQSDYDRQYKNFIDAIKHKTLNALNAAREFHKISSSRDEFIKKMREDVTSEDEGYFVYDLSATPFIQSEFHSTKNVSTVVSNIVYNHIDITTTTKKGRNFISHAIVYEPAGVVIGYAKNLDEFNENFTNKTRDYIRSLSNGDSYIFIIDRKNNKIVSGDSEEIQDSSFSLFDEKRRQALYKIGSATRGGNEAFITYKWLKQDKTITEKISFIKDINLLDWSIGTGIYLDDMHNYLDKQKNIFYSDFGSKLILFTFYLLVVVAVLYMLAVSAKKRVVTSFTTFADFFNNQTDLKRLETDKIKFQELKDIASNINKILDEKDELLDTKNQIQLALNKYKNSLETSNIVFKFNEKNLITFANSAFCDLIGYAKNELIGKPIRSIFIKERNNSKIKEVNEAVLRKSEWEGVLKAQKKNGEICHIKANVVPIETTDAKSKLNFLCICQDLTTFMEHQELMRTELQDPLTKLPTRQMLINKLSKQQGQLFVANFDILKFRQINEYYGLDIGDMVLSEVANIVRKLTKDKNLELYKLESNNFAIVGDKKHWKNDDFYKFCEKAIEYFKTNSVIVENNKFYIDLAFGISSDMQIMTSAIAKEQAKDMNQQIVVFEDKKDELAHNVVLTRAIQKAIEEDKIVLYKQAVIDNSTNTVSKYECLVRMVDDTNNVVLPIDFLAAAKKSNLYKEVTKIVIEKAFAYFAKNNENFGINLTIDDVMDGECLSQIKDQFRKHPGIGERLTIELTKNQEINDFDKINLFIDEVRKFGCKVAIDNFGTGYTNFEYLLKIKTDFIKIDGSIIKNIDHDEHARKIVKLMIELAKTLGIQTVAKYVHSSDVSKMVNSIGVDASQGFYFDMPKPLGA